MSGVEVDDLSNCQMTVGVHQNRRTTKKTSEIKKKQKKKHGMKTTESRCSEHFSLFLALGLTSALCVLECHFSLQLTEQQQYKQQWSTD